MYRESVELPWGGMLGYWDNTDVYVVRSGLHNKCGYFQWYIFLSVCGERFVWRAIELTQYTFHHSHIHEKMWCCVITEKVVKWEMRRGNVIKSLKIKRNFTESQNMDRTVRAWISGSVIIPYRRGYYCAELSKLKMFHMIWSRIYLWEDLIIIWHTQVVKITANR